MSKFCVDIAWQSLNKYGESICGDSVHIVEPKESELILVLADGLGSGVKASILSTLTAKMISTMMAGSISLEECVHAIAATLPVCAERKIAYSTFTVIHITNNTEAVIIQYDNPPVILLRNGEHLDFHKDSEIIDNKQIYKSRIRLQENDTIITMSDGAVYAGTGKAFNYNWSQEDIVEFMELIYFENYTAKTMVSLLLEQCSRLYEDKPGDDTTVCAVKIRSRQIVNLLVGPPSDSRDLHRMMETFFSREGKHIICGGTTSALAAKFLNKELHMDMSYDIKSKIPPTSVIEGVDLVTEGILTINQVVENARDHLNMNNLYNYWSNKKDGASKLSRILFEESTDIWIFVGKAINKAHLDTVSPINFNVKMRLIEELADSLKKMGKKVMVSYF